MIMMERRKILKKIIILTTRTKKYIYIYIYRERERERDKRVQYDCNHCIINSNYISILLLHACTLYVYLLFRDFLPIYPHKINNVELLSFDFTKQKI